MWLPMSRRRFRWTAILSLIGFCVAWAIIYNAESYLQAAIFLRSNKVVRNEFGNIQHDFLYSAHIKNEHADFRFYVIGDKKNGGVSLHGNEVDGHWVIQRNIDEKVKVIQGIGS